MEIDFSGPGPVAKHKTGKKRVDTIRRAIPPVPLNDWKLPTEFPDLSGAEAIAVDIETFDPDLSERGPGPMRDGYIVGVAIGTAEGYRQYFPIAHERGPNCDRLKVFEWLSRELSREGQPKIGAHIIYDLEYLAYNNVKLAGPFYDVQNAEPLLDEHAFSYSLETLAQKYLGESKVTSELKAWLETAYGKNWKSFIAKAPSSLVGPYAEGDVDLPLRIFAHQKPLLESFKLWDIFMLETRLLPMLLAMRRRGVLVDLDRAETVSAQLTDGYKTTLKKINDMAGFDVEINAAASVARAFDKLGLEYNRTLKTDAPSFTQPFLVNHPHEFPKLLVEARKFDKLNTTFVKGYIMNGHVRGRVFSQFNQLKSDESGTITGRFSSSCPNLQNIPSRDLIYGPLIRSIFVPEDGHSWWKFDWSQIEYRLIVHYAALRKLAGASDAVAKYLNDPNTDFHQVVADMTGLSRKQAKNVNFGIAYGQGVKLLCHNLGVSEEEGHAILDEYNDKAPFIKRLSRQVQERAGQRGYVRTMLGRRARFPFWEEDGSDQLFREHAPGRTRAKTYKAMNSLIQGTAADIMKKAMVDLYESGLCSEVGIPHLTVHDELDGSVLPDKMKYLDDVKAIMENAVKLHVPMVAEGGVGPNWGAIK